MNMIIALGIDGVICHYEAKVFTNGSEYGIDNGRISILEITAGDKTIVYYDRGWVFCPRNKLAEAALRHVKNLYK